MKMTELQCTTDNKCSALIFRDDSIRRQKESDCAGLNISNFRRKEDYHWGSE